jgi:hypothetical protein
MKRKLSITATALLFLGTAGLSTAFAAPAPSAARPGTTEITGCLQPGPVAKEYLLRTSDGTTWGVNEVPDLMLNNYVRQTVTVAGDAIHPLPNERKSNEASHCVRALDVVAAPAAPRTNSRRDGNM